MEGSYLSLSGTDHSLSVLVTPTSLFRPSDSLSMRTWVAVTLRKCLEQRLHARSGWILAPSRWRIWLARTSWSLMRSTTPGRPSSMLSVSLRRMYSLHRNNWVGKERRLRSPSLFCMCVFCILFIVFTVTDSQQNKNKTKKGKLPQDMLESGRYHAAVTTDDVWICYPWEAKYVAWVLAPFLPFIALTIRDLQFLT